MLAKPLVDQDEWITVKEAAKLTGDNEKEIQQLIRAGKIKTRRRARSVFVNRTSLLAAQHRPVTLTPAPYPSQIALTAIETRSLAEQQSRNTEAIRLLTQWTTATGEEAEEQRDTLAYLIEHLDTDRTSDREIFPEEFVDVILSAQALGIVEAGHDVTVATTNVKHLSLLVQAEEWHKIVP